jgi:hypothetical protein
MLIQTLKVDAACAGVELPFVLWESHRPGADAPAREHANWQARVRLFERVGARQVAGLEFLSPNFADPDGPPVPLQLFLVPVDRPASAFTANALREVALGLRDYVYGTSANDEAPDPGPLGFVGPVRVPGRRAYLARAAERSRSGLIG